MKKVLVACALMMAMMASYAQSSATPSRTPPQPAKVKTEAEKKQGVEELITKLGANASQATTIRNAYNTFTAERKKIESTRATDPTAYKAKTKAIGEGLVKQINAVLTAEQQKKFAAIIAERNNN